MKVHEYPPCCANILAPENRPWLHQKGTESSIQNIIFSRAKLAVFVEVVFPHFLLSQIHIYIYIYICFFPSFQFVSIGHPFYSGKKHPPSPKVEPCEPSPATAEVAAERRLPRGPIADAVLSSGQVGVAWLGGIDGWEGGRVGGE